MYNLIVNLTLIWIDRLREQVQVKSFNFLQAWGDPPGSQEKTSIFKGAGDILS